MVISHLYKNNDISRKITPGKILTHQTPPWKITPRKIPSQKIPTRNIPTHFINCLSPTVRFDKCSQMQKLGKQKFENRKNLKCCLEM